MKIHTLALRNIRRNKRRSLLSGSAVAVTAFCIVFMFSLVGGMLADSRKNLHDYISGVVRVEHKDFKKYSRLNPMHLVVADADSAVGLVEAIPGYQNHSIRINFGGQINVGDNENKFNARGIGVDFEREMEFISLSETMEKGRGTFPLPATSGVIMGAALAKRVGLDVGDKFNMFTMTTQNRTNYFTLTVDAIASFPLSTINNAFLLSRESAAKFLRMGDGVSEILIKIEDVSKGKEFAAELNRKVISEKRDDLIARSWDEDENSMYSMLEMAKQIYNVFALFFFILGATVILNTTMMVIFERTREIGAMQALGMEGVDLVKLFFFESLFISAVGALGGVIFGIILTLILSVTGLNLEASMESVGEMGLSNIIYPVLDFHSTGFVFLYAVAVAAIVTIIPSIRAGRLEPAEALRST